MVVLPTTILLSQCRYSSSVTIESKIQRSIEVEMDSSKNDRPRSGVFAQNWGSACSFYRQGTRSCSIEFDGLERQRCEVCREGKSCFRATERGRERQLCEAYRENKSCFLALDSGIDRDWCEHLKENKSCFFALDGSDRTDCENGRVPIDHWFWLN